VPNNFQGNIFLNFFLKQKIEWDCFNSLDSDGDETCCSIQHTLEFVCDVPRRYGYEEEELSLINYFFDFRFVDPFRRYSRSKSKVVRNCAGF